MKKLFLAACLLFCALPWCAPAHADGLLLGAGVSGVPGCPRGTIAYADGCPGVPVGAAQYPNLFTDSTGTNGGLTGGNPNAPYVGNGSGGVRPTWNVAGADYAVGPPANCGVVASTGTFTQTGALANHSAGDKVSVYAQGFTGTLPSAYPGFITQGTAYFVVNPSGSTFQLSATLGGAALTGSGMFPLLLCLQDPWPGYPSTGAAVPAAFVSQAGSGRTHYGSSGAPVQGIATQVWFDATNNPTIDGWDFSLHGGLMVSANGGGNFTLRNSYVYFGSNAGNDSCVAVGTTSNRSITIQNNILDQNGANIDATDVGHGIVDVYGWSGAGSVTLTYNQIRNAYAENINFGIDANGIAVTVQYNLIENGGLAFSRGGGNVHGDWVQMGAISINSTTYSATWSFNTWTQYASHTLAAAQGITQSPTGILTSFFQNNNTVIVTNSAYIGPAAFTVYSSGISGTAQIENNFVDPAGLGNHNNGSAGGLINTYDQSGGQSGPTTVSGNICIVNNSAISQNQNWPYTGSCT